MIDLVLGAFFALWLALLIARQFQPKWLRRFARRDALTLLPMWCFFGRKPVVREYRVLVRERSEQVWREVPQPRRTLRAAVWNPERRRRKTLFECARVVVGSRGKADPCYRTLNEWATRSDSPEFAIGVSSEILLESGARES